MPARSRNSAAASHRISAAPSSCALATAIARLRRISFSRSQQMYGEQIVSVGPEFHPSPARLGRNVGKAGWGVLVAVFGMDRLAGGERDRLAGHMHRLRIAADEMHLDPALRVVPQREVGERVGVEIGS